MDCLITVGFILLGIYLVIGVIYTINEFRGEWHPAPKPLGWVVIYAAGIIFWPIVLIREYF